MHLCRPFVAYALARKVYKMVPITIESVTRFLAYLHLHGCPVLGGRRLFRPTDWRGLGRWLAVVEGEPYLAFHLFLVRVAGFVSDKSGYWQVSPAGFEWLNKESKGQWAALIKPLLRQEIWQEGVKGLEAVISADLVMYHRQQLVRQSQEGAVPNGVVVWVEWHETEWQLLLPAEITARSLFHLLQLGELRTASLLVCNPFTVGRATQRGYSEPTIRALLNRVTGDGVPKEVEQQLTAWVRQSNQYEGRLVYLLSCRQAEGMSRLLAQPRFRRWVVEVISPRQVIIQGRSVELVRRRLATEGYYLKGLERVEHHWPGKVDPAYNWLGLRVLAGLGELLELAGRVPWINLELAMKALDKSLLAELEGMAAAILAGLKDSIRGRDVFVPAGRRVDKELVAIIETGIATEQTMVIAYQSLVDNQPHERQVFPLWLEYRGELGYLHAYCHLAEEERIFRLDRIANGRICGTKNFSRGG